VHIASSSHILTSNKSEARPAMYGSFGKMNALPVFKQKSGSESIWVPQTE